MHGTLGEVATYHDEVNTQGVDLVDKCLNDPRKRDPSEMNVGKMRNRGRRGLGGLGFNHAAKNRASRLAYSNNVIGSSK